ncbi:hypothetical protein TWF281_006994 [Arthrobotrys megalospora]
MSTPQDLIVPPSTSEAPPSDVAGAATRIDPDITYRHPAQVPQDAPAQVAPTHHKRTLPIFSLEGKTCVVTGGARGLGYVMSQAFIESGANVAIVDLNGEEAQKSAKSLVSDYTSTNPSALPPKVTAHTCDVSDPLSVASTFKKILEVHSSIDVLVTSAGFTENFKAEEYPHSRMQKLWGVNVDGTYICAVEVAKEWIKNKKQGGSIIMVGSMSGVAVNVPQPQAPYNASKAAVRQLAASFAIEWAPHGIRVNCISPGYMMTALTQKIIDEQPELYNNWVSRIPAGRMGNPVDLMGAVVYLASDASSYTTGADIRIDGGYTVI